MVAVAALILAIAGMYARARAHHEAHTTIPDWPKTLGFDDGVPFDAAARVELVERLTIIAEPWCLDALREAMKEEKHPQVRKALNEAWKSLR